MGKKLTKYGLLAASLLVLPMLLLMFFGLIANLPIGQRLVFWGVEKLVGSQNIQLKKLDIGHISPTTIHINELLMDGIALKDVRLKRHGLRYNLDVGAAHIQIICDDTCRPMAWPTPKPSSTSTSPADLLPWLPRQATIENSKISLIYKNAPQVIFIEDGNLDITPESIRLFTDIKAEGDHLHGRMMVSLALLPQAEPMAFEAKIATSNLDIHASHWLAPLDDAAINLYADNSMLQFALAGNLDKWRATMDAYGIINAGWHKKPIAQKMSWKLSAKADYDHGQLLLTHSPLMLHSKEPMRIPIGTQTGLNLPSLLWQSSDEETTHQLTFEQGKLINHEVTYRFNPINLNGTLDDGTKAGFEWKNLAIASLWDANHHRLSLDIATHLGLDNWQQAGAKAQQLQAGIKAKYVQDLQQHALTLNHLHLKAVSATLPLSDASHISLIKPEYKAVASTKPIRLTWQADENAERQFSWQGEPLPLQIIGQLHNNGRSTPLHIGITPQKIVLDAIWRQNQLHWLPTTYAAANLDIKTVDLQSLLSIWMGDNLQASGQIKGHLPITLTDKGIMLHEGSLGAEGGGMMRYEMDASQAVNMQILADALKDFHYTNLTSTIEAISPNLFSTKIRLEGANPNLYNGVPIQLNINANMDVSSLWKTRFLADKWENRLEELIRPNLTID